MRLRVIIDLNSANHNTHCAFRWTVVVALGLRSRAEHSHYHLPFSVWARSLLMSFALRLRGHQPANPGKMTKEKIACFLAAYSSQVTMIYKSLEEVMYWEVIIIKKIQIYFLLIIIICTLEFCDHLYRP